VVEWLLESNKAFCCGFLVLFFEMSGKEIGYTFAKLVTVSGDNGTGDSKSKTDFRVNLGPNMQKISRLSILSVTFPNNAYNVNDSGGGANNGFAIESDSTVHEIFLNPGFYTTATLMSAVENAVNSYLNDTYGDGRSISLAQDTLSQLVTITYTPGGGPATIDILDTETNSGIWELLGFTTLPLTVTDTQTAPDLPSLGGLKEVFLQSNELAPGNMYDRDGTQKNTLIAIPITAPFGVSNVWECKQDILCEISYLSPRSAQQCDFYLTDKFGNIINLHGGNLVINLKVWFNRY
jgi:hypothetical protein